MSQKNIKVLKVKNLYKNEILLTQIKQMKETEESKNTVIVTWSEGRMKTSEPSNDDKEPMCRVSWFMETAKDNNTEA